MTDVHLRELPEVRMKVLVKSKDGLKTVLVSPLQSLQRSEGVFGDQKDMVDTIKTLPWLSGIAESSIPIFLDSDILALQRYCHCARGVFETTYMIYFRISRKSGSLVRQVLESSGCRSSRMWWLSPCDGDWQERCMSLRAPG